MTPELKRKKLKRIAKKNGVSRDFKDRKGGKGKSLGGVEEDEGRTGGKR